MCHRRDTCHGPLTPTTLELVDAYELEIMSVLLLAKGGTTDWLQYLRPASSAPYAAFETKPASPPRVDLTSESATIAALSRAVDEPRSRLGATTTPRADDSAPISPVPARLLRFSALDRPIQPGRASPAESTSTSTSASDPDIVDLHRTDWVAVRVSGLVAPTPLASPSRSIDSSGSSVALADTLYPDIGSGRPYSPYTYGDYNFSLSKIAQTNLEMYTVYQRWTRKPMSPCSHLLFAILQVCIRFNTDTSLGFVLTSRYGTPQLGCLAVRDLQECPKVQQHEELAQDQLASGAILAVLVGLGFPAPHATATGRRKGKSLAQVSLSLLDGHNMTKGNVFDVHEILETPGDLGLAFGPGRCINHSCALSNCRFVDGQSHKPDKPYARWFLSSAFYPKRPITGGSEMTWNYGDNFFEGRCMCDAHSRGRKRKAL